MLSEVKTVPVDACFTVNGPIEFLPGVEIINTPGHTPGHFSLYIKESKTLVACDALVVENNRLEIANPQFAMDLKEAVRSVQKLLNYDLERIICYHGGDVTDNIQDKLRDLLARYQQYLSQVDSN